MPYQDIRPYSDVSTIFDDNSIMTLRPSITSEVDTISDSLNIANLNLVNT